MQNMLMFFLWPSSCLVCLYISVEDKALEDGGRRGQGGSRIPGDADGPLAYREGDWQENQLR